MKVIRNNVLGREEDFGWIIALPNGQIDFYDRAVEALLFNDDNKSVNNDLETYLLPAINIESTNFHLVAPLIVNLEVTKKCSLQCVHCYIDAGRPRRFEMSKSKVLSVLDELAAAGVFCVQITGGEPLERPDAMEILRHAHDLGFVVALSTNGVLLDEAIVRQFPTSRFSVNLSIDGTISSEVIRGPKATFELLKNKALLLRDSSVIFDVVITLNKLNIDNAPALINWCRDNDVMVETLDTFPLGRCKRNKQVLLTSEDTQKDLAVFKMKEELEDAFEYRHGPRETLVYAGFFQFGYWLNEIAGRCRGARSMAYIASNGDIYPCSNCASEGIFCGGNLRRDSFASIWQESFKGFRAHKWSDFKVCHGCEFSREPYYCCGRCPALSHAQNTLAYDKCGIIEPMKERLKTRTAEYIRMHEVVKHECSNPARVLRVKA